VITSKRTRGSKAKESRVSKAKSKPPPKSSAPPIVPHVQGSGSDSLNSFQWQPQQQASQLQLYQHQPCQSIFYEKVIESIRDTNNSAMTELRQRDDSLRQRDEKAMAAWRERDTARDNNTNKLLEALAESNKLLSSNLQNALEANRTKDTTLTENAQSFATVLTQNTQSFATVLSKISEDNKSSAESQTKCMLQAILSLSQDKDTTLLSMLKEKDLERKESEKEREYMKFILDVNTLKKEGDSVYGFEGPRGKFSFTKV